MNATKAIFLQFYKGTTKTCFNVFAGCSSSRSRPNSDSLTRAFFLKIPWNLIFFSTLPKINLYIQIICIPFALLILKLNSENLKLHFFSRNTLFSNPVRGVVNFSHHWLEKNRTKKNFHLCLRNEMNGKAYQVAI